MDDPQLRIEGGTREILVSDLVPDLVLDGRNFKQVLERAQLD